MRYSTIKEINASKPTRSLLTPFEITNKRYRSCVIRFVKCKCVCGTEVEVRLSYLIKGATVSCGCKKKQDTIDRNTKWNNNTRLIGQRYRAMIARCYDPKHPGYSQYGAKGVKVCDEWLNDYQAFVDWCNSQGISKELDLDKDTLGDGYTYSPDSCCFLPTSINRAFQPKHPQFQ